MIVLLIFCIIFYLFFQIPREPIVIPDSPDSPDSPHLPVRGVTLRWAEATVRHHRRQEVPWCQRHSTLRHHHHQQRPWGDLPDRPHPTVLPLSCPRDLPGRQWPHGTPRPSWGRSSERPPLPCTSYQEAWGSEAQLYHRPQLGGEGCWGGGEPGGVCDLIPRRRHMQVNKTWNCLL